MKIENLKDQLQKVSDPRRQWGNLKHKLWEMLIIALFSTMTLGQSYDDMEDFGKANEEWLREDLGLELKHGTADGDTYERIFNRIKSGELREYLNASLEITREKRGNLVNFDGKTKRGSKSKKAEALHVISAFATENRIVLGEIKSAKCRTEKNEIPELIKTLDIEGSIVTTDSIGCYEKTAEAIIEGEADYVIGLKKNQPKFHESVENHFKTGVRVYDKEQTVDCGHGRIEIRTYHLETDLSWLADEHKWAGLTGVGMVTSCTIRDGKTESSVSRRYYITSLDNAEDFAYAVREHWGIENNLHWCLDVIFREDERRVKNHNAALNLNILDKTALQLINDADMGKISKRRKMRNLALNHKLFISSILCEE